MVMSPTAKPVTASLNTTVQGTEVKLVRLGAVEASVTVGAPEASSLMMVMDPLIDPDNAYADVTAVFPALDAKVSVTVSSASNAKSSIGVTVMVAEAAPAGRVMEVALAPALRV